MWYGFDGMELAQGIGFCPVVGRLASGFESMLPLLKRKEKFITNINIINSPRGSSYQSANFRVVVSNCYIFIFIPYFYLVFWLNMFISFYMFLLVKQYQ